MEPADQLRRAGMPETVVAMMEDLGSTLAGEVCGRCTAFDAETSTCKERGGMRVKATDRGCPLFVLQS